MDIIYDNPAFGRQHYDIRKVPKEKIGALMKELAEGSKALEKCLLDIYNVGVFTDACCKGNHITMHGEDPDICDIAYISFSIDSDWKDYLSDDIIDDKFVVIENKSIYYYGQNHDCFFRKLGRDFKTGKKKNQPHLSEKMSSYNEELRHDMHKEAHIFCLKKNGFTDDQIEELMILGSKNRKIWMQVEHTEDKAEREKLIIQGCIYDDEYNAIIKRTVAENIHSSRRHHKW